MSSGPQPPVDPSDAGRDGRPSSSAAGLPASSSTNAPGLDSNLASAEAKRFKSFIAYPAATMTEDEVRRLVETFGPPSRGRIPEPRCYERFSVDHTEPQVVLNDLAWIARIMVACDMLVICIDSWRAPTWQDTMVLLAMFVANKHSVPFIVLTRQGDRDSMKSAIKAGEPMHCMFSTHMAQFSDTYPEKNSPIAAYLRDEDGRRALFKAQRALLELWYLDVFHETMYELTKAGRLSKSFELRVEFRNAQLGCGLLSALTLGDSSEAYYAFEFARLTSEELYKDPSTPQHELGGLARVLAVIHANIGKVLRGMGDYTLSARSEETAMRWLELAFQSEAETHPDETTEALERTIAAVLSTSEPTDTSPGDNYQVWRTCLRRHERAIALRRRYKRAWSAGSAADDLTLFNHCHSMIAVGDLHRIAGNYEEAIEWYDRVVSLIRLVSNAANAKGESETRQLRRLQSYQAEVLTRRALVLIQMGEFSRSQWSLERALVLFTPGLPKNHPKIAATYVNLSHSIRARTDAYSELSTGYEMASKALQLAAKYPKTEPMLAAARLEMIRCLKARREFSAAKFTILALLDQIPSIVKDLSASITASAHVMLYESEHEEIRDGIADAEVRRELGDRIDRSLESFNRQFAGDECWGPTHPEAIRMRDMLNSKTVPKNPAYF